MKKLMTSVVVAVLLATVVSVAPGSAAVDTITDVPEGS